MRIFFKVEKNLFSPPTASFPPGKVFSLLEGMLGVGMFGVRVLGEWTIKGGDAWGWGVRSEDAWDQECSAEGCLKQECLVKARGWNVWRGDAQRGNVRVKMFGVRTPGAGTFGAGTLGAGMSGAGTLSTADRRAMPQQMLPADAPTGALFGKQDAAAKPRRVFPPRCVFPARRGAEPGAASWRGQGERLGTARSRVRLPAPGGQGGSRALEREKKEGKKKKTPRDYFCFLKRFFP